MIIGQLSDSSLAYSITVSSRPTIVADPMKVSYKYLASYLVNNICLLSEV